MRRRFLTLGLLPALMLLAAACGEDAPTPTSVPPTPSPTPHMVETPAPETTEVSAPIENVAVNIAESDPPQYFLEITSGLPDACHTFDRVETERSGTEITVTVINRVVTGDVMCAQVYGTETNSVALGADFDAGVTYTVRVNDWETSFTTASATVEAEAPIEDVVVNIAESDPPQYFLEITSGLPDACHTFDRVEEERSGREITVSVINRVAPGEMGCAEIYKTERHSVALGSDFEPGVTYTVRVNGETLTFTAEGGAADSGASGAGDDRGQGEGDEDSGGDSTTVEVAAPIESVAVNIAESDPPQYFLEITSGLPDACHAFDRVETDRSGTAITVTVINKVVTGDVMCAQVYETVSNTVELGSEFDAGVTYTVRVNDEMLTFTAQ